MIRMDYDLTDIPKGYDRARDHGPEVLKLWMNALASHLQGRNIARILDLGCGTGRFTESLALHFDARVIGLDPSLKMLEQARAKRRDDRVEYRRGSAEAIPLPDESLDAVFMSMSFHHFTDPASAARECRRALVTDGLAFVRTGTRERAADYPYVRFLPRTKPMIEAVLPDVRGLRDIFEGAGFAFVDHEIVHQIIAPGWAAYAEKLAAGGDSVLATLDSQELEAGLSAMRAHAAAAMDAPIVEPIDLLVFRAAARN